MFFALLLITCYVVSYIKARLTGEQVYNGYITAVTLLTCSSPLIVGIIRVYRTRLFSKLFSKLCPRFCKSNGNYEIKEGEENLVEKDTPERGGRINDIEKKLLEKLIIKYFTAISYVIGKSKYSFNEKDEIQDINNSNENKINMTENNEYKITKAEILKDFDLSINEDIKVLQEESIDIEITEFNPTIFKKLRELENFNEDKLISMFQPKKGTIHLINKINNTIYINAIDKLLMLKQIDKETLLCYQRNILPHLYNHLVNHQNSIICRIFGLYKIKIDQASDTYFALMYNINESLDCIDLLNLFEQKNENIKHMKLEEQELKSKLIIENQELGLQADNNNLDNGGSGDKEFKMFMTNNEFDKLNNILLEDAKFLKTNNIFGFKFLIFEKNMSTEEKNGIFEENENKNTKMPRNIKKYMFNSYKPGLFYSICIVDYFKNKL